MRDVDWFSVIIWGVIIALCLVGFWFLLEGVNAVLS